MATPSLPNINAFNIESTDSIITTITYQANNGYTPISKSVVYILDATGNEIGHHTYTNNSTEILATTHPLSNRTTIYDATTGIGWTYPTGKSSSDLENNKQYQMYIKWYDTSATPQAQPESNYIGFWALPQPTIEIQIPSATISVTSYTVTANYSKAGAIINNAPSATQFSLYLRESTTPEVTGRLVQQSPILYTSGTIGAGGTYQLNYQFVGLENNETYWIEVETISTQGMVAHNGQLKNKLITPTITIEELNVLKLEPNNCEGCVNIIGTINNITGIYDDNPSATVPITPTGLDLKGHNLVFDDGLQFTNDWNLSFWGTDFTYANNIQAGSGQEILHLSNFESLENGIIDIFMVHAPSDNTKQKAIMVVYPLGYNGGISSYFESNEVLKPNKDNNEYTCVQIQYKDYYYYINLGAPQVINPRT